jgi:CubicO group peptidase (beta-lactamase class C family)
MYLAVLAGACSSAAPEPSASTTPTVAPEPAAEPAAPEAPAKKLDADTPMTTVEGSKFIAPEGWSVTVRGPATILEAPEGGSYIALVDLRAKDADEAVRKAWAAYKADFDRSLLTVNKWPDENGWTDMQTYRYDTSPNESRGVAVGLQRAGDVWTAAIYDMADAVAEKRGGQVSLIFGQLLPKGGSRESFAGKKAHVLDQARIDELVKFVTTAQKELGVPGISVGLVQDGKVVFADGFGEKELGKKNKPDADTLFMIGSNTKALTTLLLAKLVDEQKLMWETPVTTLLPSFKLGDADTTSQVLVKHLICACTGMPRQDFDWIFQFEGVTPKDVMTTLGTMQPTSKFGELFQYSNIMAAAAGYVAGHVKFPKSELGLAYDKAMKKLVFGPLKMKATTFDYAKALSGNHAAPHGLDIDGKTTSQGMMGLNYSVIPVRPAGAAWSNVGDMLKFVTMELKEGALQNGKRYVSQEALLARRTPQISIGKDITYGMGLMVDTTYGVPVVGHNGATFGYLSEMMWLPEHGVGAVVLTNSALGGVVSGLFKRKLLEVLFDGRPEADAQVSAVKKAVLAQVAAAHKLLTTPADAKEAAKLAAHYSNPALGEISVAKNGDATIFDFGEFKSEVASRKNPDGTVSFITIAPAVSGFEFVVGKGEKRTLTTRDAQHEYVFSE